MRVTRDEFCPTPAGSDLRSALVLVLFTIKARAVNFGCKLERLKSILKITGKMATSRINILKVL